MVEPASFFSLLKNITVFSGISDDDLRRVCHDSPMVEFPDQSVIIEEGTDATEIFLILQGRVRIVIGLQDHPMEIVELGPGSVLGEASVIGIQPHSASAVAIGPVTLLVLSRRMLMEIQKNDIQLFSLIILNIARELARRLNNTDQMLLMYGKAHITV